MSHNLKLRLGLFLTAFGLLMAGYVYRLMDQGGPTDNREPYFREFYGIPDGVEVSFESWGE